MGQSSPVSRTVRNTGRRRRRAATNVPTSACLSCACSTSARIRRASSAAARNIRKWNRGLAVSRVGAITAPAGNRRQNGYRATVTPSTVSRAAAP